MRRVAFVLLLAILAAFAWTRLNPGGATRRPESFTPAAGPQLSEKDLPGLHALDAEYTRLVESVVPSVVSINTTRRTRVPVMDSMDYFFGWRGRTQERTSTSLGSGVIVSKEGHILTNHHVVEGMSEIQVQLTDSRTLPAVLIGSDASVDIAVLSIQAPNLVPLPLGDSDTVKVGQQVVAVGNPFGLQESVTRGIISAKGRALPDSGVEFFQTDAAVNPGNSGGPLLDIRGQIVGINSAIYSRTGNWAGISFAIPANVARKTLESILHKGRPVRGYLGVAMTTLSPARAQQLGVRDGRGALVSDVVPDSPADKSGLREGDVIRSFNGRAIASPQALRDQVAGAEMGAKVELGILREGQEQKVMTEITEMPAGSVAAAPPSLPPGGGARSAPPRAVNGGMLAGVVVGPIAEALRETLPANLEGVQVLQIEPDAPAAEKLRVGDVIAEINRRPVGSVADFEAAARALPAEERVLLFVCRGRARSYVVVTP